jgi:hypothetical protein
MQKPTQEEIKSVRSSIEEEPGAPLSMLAKKLSMPQATVVESLPEEMRISIPADNFEEVWAEICTWEKVTFIVTNEGAIIEASGRLPQGKFGHGYFNLDSGTGMFGGHLRIDTLGSIWLVSKPFFKVESHSVQFFTQEGNSMCAVYVGRGPERELLEDVLGAYKSLWSKYAE